MILIYSSYDLKINGNSFNLPKDVIEVKTQQKVVHVEEITPNVIEPSFGIGRIIYALFEQSFKTRELDEQRTVNVKHLNVFFFFNCRMI